MKAMEANPAVMKRAEALLGEALARHHRAVDRLFLALMALQWVGGILAALMVSPRTWIGAASQTHISVYAAVFGGALLSALPVALAIARPGEAFTRHVIAAAQMLWSALLIHLTGGRIETHFHVFGSLAFLSFYRDWKVLVTATVVVAIDHAVRGLVAPQSVFGVASAASWRWMEHAGWVVFEDVFLVLACVSGLGEMRSIATRQAELEASKAGVEAVVEARTAELEEARRAAVAASGAKTHFLANMSHEIRTPMTAIIGYADLLLDPAQTPSDRVESLQTIRRNGQHLMEIINDILDLSKIEAGRMTVETIDTDPVQIAEEVRSLMQVRAGAKGVSLKVEYRFPLPVTFKSDPTRLRQILMNMVGNAIKFTEQGGVTIRVSLERGAKALLRFEVEDTGVGMTPEQQQRLFQPFSQADSSTTRRFGGAGLGLVISKRLALALGGDIVITSTPGKGTVATATVAAGAIDETALRRSVDARPSRSEGAPEAGANGAALRGRILLAEDGPDNQRLISFVLRKEGAEVEIVENGRAAAEQALEALERGNPFDLILMDMQMPVLDGYGAASLLRAKGYEGPIVALTAHAMPADRQRCLDAGCDDYATKPIDRVRLVELCARLMSDQSAAAGSADSIQPPPSTTSPS